MSQSYIWSIMVSDCIAKLRFHSCHVKENVNCQ